MSEDILKHSGSMGVTGRPDNASLLEQRSPTFQEFVAYILDQADEFGVDSLNPHFRPQWHICPYCSGRYMWTREKAPNSCSGGQEIISWLSRKISVSGRLLN